MSSAWAKILADTILVVHASIVVWIVGGQLAIWLGGVSGWSWVRARGWRIAHLATIGFVTLQTWLGWLCPLTIWEDELRRLAGQPGYPRGFIAYWLHRFVYVDAPPMAFTIAYTLFGLLVLVTWWLVPPRAHTRGPVSR